MTPKIGHILTGHVRSSELGEGINIYFRDLVIPFDPENPFPLHLRVPGSTIHAVLFDNGTGRAFQGSEPLWSASLFDLKTTLLMSGLRDRYGGNPLHLIGVPAGEYQLIIKARGFHDYNSKTISIVENQNLDIGRIGLDPCGILVLEVLDVTGQNIPSFNVWCGEGFMYEFNREILSPGRYCYNNLPLGPAEIKVKANGFKEHKVSVEFKPAQPVEVRVVMQGE